MTEEHPPPTVPSRLDACTPAQKLTYYALASLEPATQDQIARDACLPKRTVRYALKRLDAEGEVEWSSAGGDGRKKWYELVRR